MDPGSGKHTILGVFSNIKAHRFPVTHPFMVWFMTLTDCSPGEHKMRISMGLEATQVQPLIERPFESRSPLDRINLINEIRNLTFPQAGDYSLLVEIDDEPILATNLTVTGNTTIAGTLQIEVDGGSVDLLAINGKVNISAATPTPPEAAAAACAAVSVCG
jgi:hypothetical protein